MGLLCFFETCFFSKTGFEITGGLDLKKRFFLNPDYLSIFFVIFL